MNYFYSIYNKTIIQLSYYFQSHKFQSHKFQSHKFQSHHLSYQVIKMSRNNNNIKNNNKINTNAKSEPKKYCKVCHDAGKSESEYQSHFIRENTNPNSKVVCPTLLSLECRYCSKKGHTVKYCKILEKDKKLSSRRQENTNNYRETNKNDMKGKQTNNIFDNLESDSEEEDEKEKLPEIRFVEPVSTNKYLPKSYASVLSSPAVELVKKVVNLPILTSTSVTTEQKEKVEHTTKTFNVAKYIGKSWADDDDTESESDIDEEKNYDPNW